MRISRTASRQWPKENLSHNEIIRRYILIGIAAMHEAKPDEIDRTAHQLQASVDSGDERLQT